MQELEKAEEYLNTLCSVKPNRRTGSPGNRAATDFFAAMVKKWGYTVDTTPFLCLDYKSGEISLACNNQVYEVYVSQFSPGCDVTAKLVTVSTIEELESCQCKGEILLMRGSICAEQLMPKNFVFYNPDQHKRIYSLLEEKQPAAIITATAKNPELVGALYPFPLIEDGDFDIPSVYCTDVVGQEISAKTGEVFRLVIEANRITATACNVIALKNQAAPQKIVVSAHIDAYWSTPGALDDASGTVVLLLLAEMLQDYKGNLGIEIVAFNGEDYYSAGGQMDYLRRFGKDLAGMSVAINVDDVGYKQGKTAYSLYDCPDEIKQKAHNIFGKYDGIVVGEPWYQGDHMIFVQNKKPAIAFTSENVAELMATITHSPKDTPDVVDCRKLVELAHALKDFIQAF
ncbi:MAG: M28 family peptidase [Dehalogenimonas sp.]|uniref:M28 family peptidase n=1 Tax=Candidatus Dehalogenimonas loeffleri TaxID=3127115 RepID=A0ABZ2JAX3_9CHLR|nr:M28 family peptidase [Dehalogenimonas sp.]